MKLRHLLLGAGLGICTAVVVKQYVMKPYISSEKALRIVKSAFKRRGRLTDHGFTPSRSLTILTEKRYRYTKPALHDQLSEN